MNIISKAAIAGIVLLSVGACSSEKPQPPAQSEAATEGPTRIRGAAETVTPDLLTILANDGQSVDVALDDKTRYVWVTASSLATLKNGDFIGAGTTGSDDNLRAVEVTIFPESMRGTGEGHYPWEVPPAAGSQAGGGMMTNGTVGAMTNGTVTQGAMTNGTVTQGAMTNGTVTGGGGVPGVTTLSVSYKGGTSQILVPEGVPVVRLEPTDKAALAKGQKLFVLASPAGADGKLTAAFVAIGKDGLTPPM